MISRLLRTDRRLTQRRLFSLAVLLGVCASLVPIPLPSNAPRNKDKSTPFPCQNRPCGCRSAEQCWKKCCCFSNSQKLAWARAHRVNAPQYVHAAAAEESKSPACKQACCSNKSPSDLCCRSPRQTDQTSTPAKTLSSTFHSAKADQPDDYVLAVMAERCRGQSTFWNSLPWAVIPELDITVDRPCVESPEHSVALVYPTITDQPPVPPPRQSLILEVI